MNEDSSSPFHIHCQLRLLSCTVPYLVLCDKVYQRSEEINKLEVFDEQFDPEITGVRSVSNSEGSCSPGVYEFGMFVIINEYSFGEL